MFYILLCAMAVIAAVLAIRMYVNMLDAYKKSDGTCYINPLLHKAVAVGALVSAENPADALKWLYMIVKHYSSGVVVGYPLLPTVLLSDPDHLKAFLNNPHGLDRALAFEFFEGWFDLGMIGLRTPEWRPHRKILQSVFKLYDPHVVANAYSRHTLDVMERMEKYSNGEEFDSILITQCVIGGIMENVLGIQMPVEDREKFLHLSEVCGVASTSRVYKIWLRPQSIFTSTKEGRYFLKMKMYCNNYIRNVVEKRKKVLSASTTQPHENNAEESLSMLDHMLKSDYEFSERELLAELNSIIFAGFDTMGHSFCFLLYLLATHLDVQEKLYNELHEIYGNSDPKDNPTTADDFPKMEYTERVIKESMRLFAPVTTSVRRTRRNIKIGDIHIPAGHAVLGLIGYMHRNEEYWPNPLEFVPDRFLPDHPLGPRHPFAYIPFSVGPRNCIGAQYAMNATRAILATLSRRYVFKTKNPKRPVDVRFVNSIATLPFEPLMVYVERRMTSSV